MKIYPQESKTERELEVENNYVEIKKSNIPGAGLGVFAKKDIKAGEELGFYRGEWLTVDEYVNQNRSFIYVLGLPNGIYIDAEKNGYNWVSRVNTPRGTSMKTNMYWDADGRVFAKRNIKAGEELYVGYGKAYWRAYKKYTLKNKSSKRNTTLKNSK
jgi:hypothetical protein